MVDVLRYFWELRGGGGDPPHLGVLYAVAEATVIDLTRGPIRKNIERDRLLELRALLELREQIEPDLSARRAAAGVLKVLNIYRTRQWINDQERGFCISGDRAKELCFAVLKLSSGRLSRCKLQRIFRRGRKKTYMKHNR